MKVIISIILLALAVCAMGDVTVNKNNVAVYPAVTSDKDVLTIEVPKDTRPGTDSQAATVDIHPAKITGGYVVVTSKATYESVGWSQVVKALSYKYSAEVLVYDGSPSSVKEELSKRMPRYTCFVAMTCTHFFVHFLMRLLA